MVIGRFEVFEKEKLGTSQKIEFEKLGDFWEEDTIQPLLTRCLHSQLTSKVR